MLTSKMNKREGIYTTKLTPASLPSMVNSPLKKMVPDPALEMATVFPYLLVSPVLTELTEFLANVAFPSNVRSPWIDKNMP